MKKCIIVGGSNGIGLAFLNNLQTKYDQIIVLDVVEPKIKSENIEYKKFDLSKDNLANYEQIFAKCTTLIITAGIGRVAYIKDISLPEIEKIVKVNLLATIKILKMYYNELMSSDDRFCMVMGSLAGDISSPLFSVYAATKAGINRFIESVNIELEMQGSNNRITNIKPISFKGSSFNDSVTDLDALNTLSLQCLSKMFEKDTEFIPDYDAICKDIINKYKSDSHQFGIQSYNYKIKNNRLSDRKLIKIGYLSGTFDLFHVGHLNLIKRAKECCDYLIVGIHKSGAWKGKETFIPFEERCDIVRNIKYVDEVHESYLEDSEAWEAYHYDFLFVGSDYKGTERFKRYEEFFKDKNVEIIYFPYTKGTSSTQLRKVLKETNK